MFRVLLIYAAAVVAFILAGTVITNTPLEQVAWLAFLVEVIPLATWGGAMLIRHMMRQPRQDDWQHLGCDPVAPPLPLPEPQRVIRIERPAPLQIEAPRRELTQWHRGTD